MNVSRSREWTRNPYPYPYKRPQRRADEGKELYQCIADAGSAGAASVTRAERNIIFYRTLPRGDVRRLCMSKVGITMLKLGEKAIARLDTLEEAKCNVSIKGTDHNNTDNWRNPFWLTQLPPPSI